MKRAFLIALILLGTAHFAHAQNSVTPKTPAASGVKAAAASGVKAAAAGGVKAAAAGGVKAAAAGGVKAAAAGKTKPPQRTAAQWMARARALKARRDYKGARLAVYNAMDIGENWKNPEFFYLLGWIDIAQQHRAGAISNFRLALRDGLKGKEAVEARGALRRMGVSEQFPKYKPRPRSLTATLLSSALMADAFKPTPLRWAIETAVALAIAGVGWLLVALLGSWAAQQKLSGADFKVIAFWCAMLLLLRALGQFAVSFRYILPLTLAYLGLGLGQFLAPLFYGVRRLVTKKVTDKGAIIAWGVFYTLMFLVIVGGSTPLAPYFIGLALASALLWLGLNPWFIAGQRAEARKRKGDLATAIGIYEKSLARPKMSDKTRFVLSNDLASLQASMGNYGAAIAHSEEALRHVHAFKSAEVMPRLNLAESLLALGRNHDALDQLGRVWDLAHSGDCMLNNGQWQGTVHGMLAMLNFWRGWSDEAVHQSELCIEAFPSEKRATQSSKNLVAIARAIKGLALFRAGDVEAGARYLEAAPKVGAKRDALAFVQFAISQGHEMAGDLTAALGAANAALEATPNYFPAQLQRADLIAQMGRKSEAATLLRGALGHHEKHVLAPLARQKLVEWDAPTAPLREASPFGLQPALAETRTMI